MWLSHKAHELKAAEITEKANTSKKAVMSAKVVIAAAMARMAIAVNILRVLGLLFVGFNKNNEQKAGESNSATELNHMQSCKSVTETHR